MRQSILLTLKILTKGISLGRFIQFNHFWVLLFVFLGSCTETAQPKKETTPPNSEIVATSEGKANVLVLMFDDMRFDSFSYRGGPVDTPNIDALAAESTQFNSAMTTTGLCSPSRAAFFTGRWGHRTGLDDNVELFHSRLYELSRSEGGLIRRASDAGYNVGYVGKWHLGAKGPSLRGANFVTGKSETVPRKARHRVPNDRLEGINRYKAGLLDEGGQKHQYYRTLPGTYEETEAAEKVRNGQKMLRLAADDDRPFFGVISFNQPHPAYKVPEPYASLYDHKTVELPDNHLAKRVGKPMTQDGIYWPWHDVSHMSDTDWRKSRSFYYGAIAMVDRAIGEIIETAKEEGLYDDLHIVLIGDQGSMIGEHSLYDKGPYAYDELMRIPLLIKSPKIKPRIVNRQVSLIDVPATLGELMALENDGAVDGHSLLPLMTQGDAAEDGQTDTALYAYEWYNGSWFGVRALRTPDMKFVWYAGDNVDELYDLEADPGEMNNLITSQNHSADILRLIDLLEAEMVAVDDPLVEILRHHRKMYLPENK